MFKKLLIALSALVVLVGAGFTVALWPDHVARTTTLETLNAKGCDLTRYADPETAQALQSDNYRVVLESDDQGWAGTAAYAMRINGVSCWVELSRTGKFFPREKLVRISTYQPDGTN
ncbi:hypothetical protein [Lacticaseibacillus camelliae]|uniref:Uncharacterized protein n=1 Tax=Lacticaseibacillus camelliae DSM 22697 = JCM 13995 TaxID=1423730 RepID=A0A0R2FGX7_9LACO|nr:hypothetical protein [Lacticaseibacillus camelliae]KRN25317.1 hypothetical protein FC75_GL000679 [Lacticaseibacillus camelliae DSM 22697 = JCM 13995]